MSITHVIPRSNCSIFLSPIFSSVTNRPGIIHPPSELRSCRLLSRRGSVSTPQEGTAVARDTAGAGLRLADLHSTQEGCKVEEVLHFAFVVDRWLPKRPHGKTLKNKELLSAGQKFPKKSKKNDER